MAGNAPEAAAEPVDDASAAAASVPADAAAPPTAEKKPVAAEHVRSLRTAYKVVAAVVGVLSSITALVFTFVPDLRPIGEAPKQSAELSDLRVDADATFGQYLARLDQPRAGYSEQQLRRRGALLDFRVRIEGFKGRTLLLKWELFDDADGEQVNESKAIRITPTNQTNEATWQFWVPVPYDRGTYVAIVELIEQKKTHLLKLASLETAPLRGLGR